MSRNPTKALSTLLRELRRRHNWTLKQLSLRSGVPVSTLSKVEHGQLTLGYDRLIAMAERLDMSLSEFLGSANPDDNDRVSARRSIGNLGQATRLSTSGGELFLLCPELRHKRITPFITHVLSKKENPVHRVARYAREHFAYVLAGQVEVQTEFYEAVILSPDDCIYMDANMEHAFELAPNCAQATLLGVLVGDPELNRMTPPDEPQLCQRQDHAQTLFTSIRSGRRSSR
jgi:transcriptional regulator with XRE-family HTH domain